MSTVARRDYDVLSIGDCSNRPSRFLGRRVRLESVPNALEQARVAASVMCGRLEAYDAVPWFWSDQYDLKLQAVGMSDGHDQSVIRGTMQSRNFTIFYLREGVLIAADCVNRPADFLMAKRLATLKPTIDVSALADERMVLRSLSALEVPAV